MSSNPIKILPPEWAEQQFVQLTWPHAGTDWANMLDEVTECFVQIAHEIMKREKLLIVCDNFVEILPKLGKADFSKVRFALIPTNDTWARDHGGITVFDNGIPVINDFGFNGWGNKFPAELDNRITATLYEQNFFGKSTYKNCLDFILEGGSIESDGVGTLLTTSQCLLALNRNNKSKDEIEIRLKELFGLEQILWLNHGFLAGDDTDSHVDTLARFCSINTIAYVSCSNESDIHYAELKAMEAELQEFKTLDGKPYNLIPLPMAPESYGEGGRLPATYANFLIINGAVLYPTYNSTKDELAGIQLQNAFPDREIVGINCNVLINQHGSLHCVTMQYPSPQPSPKERERS